ncbi:hypothetical protein H2198_004614 [Neophaeococcomyces mojaviensis]|uniref:Uncharacterized protein n=1 Tax=Neophaeococcomyces mojaviensis TaxID=3383035 RepID=A0ACC3A836_9EURO|nr:hypothetical protein H2198_004614 [Knufia sp. JES_112]
MSTDESAKSRSQLGDNGFPKITGKVNDFLYQLQELKDQQQHLDFVPIVGTVKLHGMHADILFSLTGVAKRDSKSSNEDPLETELASAAAALNLSEKGLEECGVSFQSRNVLCDAEASNHGWPRDIARHPDALQYLKTRVMERYLSRYPGASIDRTQPLIIAGEWIGTGVQKGVGISKLSPRFIILGIKINGQWQPDDDYSDIEANKAGIFTIHRVPQFKFMFDMSDISENNYVLLDMQRIADDVEFCCPYAAHFGIENSRGEGVVWKIGTLDGITNPKCWFKTKGPISGPENRIDPQSITRNAEKKLTVNSASEKWVSKRRVEQGFEYLLELGLEPSKESMKQFINWVVQDVMTEEKSEIDKIRSQYSDASRLVKAKVGQLAREKYFETMREVGIDSF